MNQSEDNGKKFMYDLQKIYNELQRRQAELNGYYALTKGGHFEADRAVAAFLDEVEIERNEESVMAALVRIVGLREDALEQALKKMGYSEEEQISKKEKAYLFVSRFHLERHASLVAWIEERRLLTTFYRTLIAGVDAVGAAMSGWQSAWTARLRRFWMRWR